MNSKPMIEIKTIITYEEIDDWVDHCKRMQKEYSDVDFKFKLYVGDCDEKCNRRDK